METTNFLITNDRGYYLDAGQRHSEEDLAALEPDINNLLVSSVNIHNYIEFSCRCPT